MQNQYKNQVQLLIKCLPAIFKEKCFAIKGGTAINLFYSNLPRLSVDIDLVYLPIEDRSTTYINIYKALDRITDNLKIQGFDVKKSGKGEVKLFCSDSKAKIKIEPNYNIRGCIFKPKVMEICEKAQNLFGYAKANIISYGELWGGKICAALDRQHPRDLFDIRNLLDNTGINSEIKDSFIAFLLSVNRPLHEILDLNFQMKEFILNKEFEGMTETVFTFENAKEVFDSLVKEIKFALTDQDKRLLLDFVQLKADLINSGIPNLDKFPSIQWKIMNLKQLQNQNPKKFKDQYEKLKIIL